MLLTFASPTAGARARAALRDQTPGRGVDDLRLAVAVVAEAPTAADLLGLQSLRLTRLAGGRYAPFFLGTDLAGLTFTAVNGNGIDIPTTQDRRSLMRVTAARVISVGLSRQATLTK